ncbi:RNA-binding protein [Arenibaculum pallidiluteum]|uniref:RNA-binding protein n=1 Tax=Arenibaculum pallidiluteum TaxID=2812559 RepID=UPI001F26597E|nr:RNA-binding protein [Arenibaculum pallidiluteum]
MDPAGDGPGPEGPEDEPEAVGGRNSPLRRCIATGTVQAKDGMVRFVVGPDGTVVPDVEERLPGRGFWITADPALIRKVADRGGFSRAARRTVRAEPDLAERVGKLLEARCLALLGMARRSGQALAGFEKVREALRAGEAAVLLAAKDGAEDGKAKLRALAANAAPGIALVELFEAAAIGAALGRDIAVHACVSRGRLAKGFLADCRRYAAFAGGRVDMVMPGPVTGQRDETTN